MTTSNATSLSGKNHPGPSLLDFPTETLHKIFTYLTPTEAANVRLANTKLAAIGIEYIVPEIFLVLTEDSFNKLEAIAQHPVIKKHVNSLVYNGIQLEELDPRGWEWSVYMREARVQYDAMPPQRFTEGPEREAEVATQRRNVEQPRHHYTQDELDVGFARYQQIREEQSRLQQDDVHLERIVKVLAEFPALKNIVLDAYGVPTGVGLSTRQLWAAFGPVFSRGCWPRPGNNCVGRSEVHAILKKAHQAKMRLETFTCNLLGFRYFSDKPQDYASYGRSLIHLKSLDLQICDMDGHDGFITCLSSGRVLSFLTAAPHLKRLRLGINVLPTLRQAPAELEYFVGSFRWTSLVQVAFARVSVNKNGFIEFLERHSSTLKAVELRQLILTDGTWTSIFQMMRSVLELDEVGFHGRFADEAGHFEFDVLKTVAGISFRKNVHDYILGATEDFQSIEAYLDEHRHRRLRPSIAQDLG